MLRAISGNEKGNIVAIGGSAFEKPTHRCVPFISVHRIGTGNFPHITTSTYPNLEESITNLEFLWLCDEPTLLASDDKNLMVIRFAKEELRVLQVINLHQSKTN